MLELVALPFMLASAAGAQANPATPPPLEAPAPHWISNNPAGLKYLLENVKHVRRDPNEVLAFGSVTYTEKGPLGIPALEMNAPDFEVRKRGGTIPFNLSGGACFVLDLIAQQAGAWGPACKVKKILEMPKKGKLKENPDTSVSEYLYTVQKLGKDRVRYILENGAGKEVDVTYHFRNVKFVPSEDAAIGTDGSLATRENGNGPEFEVGELEANINFAVLRDATLAQTTGTGPTATITLDTDAAGHGWFIDYTPFLNEEYLPTSNPYEWIAKPGSEAEGKMDMLTVLQHEYLHTAGFDHSAEPGNIMVATLQPGVRRTLTPEQQLALMRLAGYFPVPGSDPSTPWAPRDPGAPLPYSRGSTARTPARRRVVDTLGLGLNGKQAVPQFDTAANPTLTNPAFTGNTGWSTTGPIAFANNAATLTESATAQTRLNQVFVVGPNDRFLSFTLANIGLDDPSTRSGQVKATAPDDAFEVALLNANTGASLLAGTGLTKSDAILNLQANGTERKASGLTSVLNPDGSRTYLVDLSGIAAGTVVNLSFDLIGFGRGAAATSSHVTVRDLHLGLPLDVRNDTAATAEDTPVDINPLSNNPGADPQGVLPVIKQTPSHGTVEITLDGKLRYVPNPNWFGEDSFTYQLTDGALASGAATVRVSIRVSPVNDAPTLADQSLTRPQNQPITGNLRR